MKYDGTKSSAPSKLLCLDFSVCKLAQETFRNWDKGFLVNSAISKPRIDVFGAKTFMSYIHFCRIGSA